MRRSVSGLVFVAIILLVLPCGRLGSAVLGASPYARWEHLRVASEPEERSEV